MAWIVKAHVFQAIRGTLGHSSLGAVCSPTRWMVVAHTTSISMMLSENFLLHTAEFRLVTHCRDSQCCHGMDVMLLYSRLLHSIAEDRPEVRLTFSTQAQVTISTLLCVAVYKFWRAFLL